MNLFGWLKRDPASKGFVPARAVVIPHFPRSESIWNQTESNFSADSTTTLSVTVRPLKDGETAEQVGSQYPRLEPTGMHRTTSEPEGCYRLHVNVPNWTHRLVMQTGWVIREHVDIPIWLDPKTGEAKQVDKDKLIQELTPMKDLGTRIWESVGFTGRYEE